MTTNDAYLNDTKATKMDKVKNLNFKSSKPTDPLYRTGVSSASTINPSNLEAKYSKSGTGKISYKGGSASASVVNPGQLELDFNKKSGKGTSSGAMAAARAGRA